TNFINYLLELYLFKIYTNVAHLAHIKLYICLTIICFRKPKYLILLLIVYNGYVIFITEVKGIKNRI
ncbi:MAG TPA: hypothetical protein DCO75_03140, partial [Fibrobacteres bacterium]|nr:hypothetical protein [Fibrobacterota bacterium]